MNSWKESPHLFANGKFRIKATTSNGCDYESPLQGSLVTDYDGCWWLITDDYQDSISIDECTLIARPISDMSDEEKEILDDLEEEINLGYWYLPSPECFLYLLSIGVYPFDQSHFETGDVLPA